MTLIAAGYFFLGAGLGLGTTTASLDGGGGGFGISLDLSLEFDRVLILGNLQYVNFGAGEAGLVSVRAGGFLSGGPTAPYLAIGAGKLGQNVFSRDDCVNGSCNVYTGSGWAAVGEGGAMFFRDKPWLRLTLFAQAIVPAFTVPVGFSGTGTRIPIVLFALRAQL